MQTYRVKFINQFNTLSEVNVSAYSKSNAKFLAAKLYPHARQIVCSYIVTNVNGCYDDDLKLYRQ